MDSLPTFPLFPDPIREQVFKKSNARCGVCHQARGMLYEGFGARGMGVCPWCIANGDAGRLEMVFNDAHVPGSAAMSIADQDLVEHRTPGFVTWQDNHWAVCCGRACIYLGEAEAADLQGRWAEAVPSIAAYLRLPMDEFVQMVGGFRRGSSPAAYVFRCQVCSKIQGYSDFG